MKRFRAFKAAQGLELQVYGPIGDYYDEISAADILRELDAAKDARQITLRIHSPGGDPFEAFAMYSALRAHPAKVTAQIDGTAASAAFLLAMAGDTVTMPERGFLMGHSASGLVMGNAKDMREIANTLDKIDGEMFATIRERYKGAADKFERMKTEDVWWTSQEAVDDGLADSIVARAEQPEDMAAYLDTAIMATYKHRPDELRHKAEAGKISTALRDRMRRRLALEMAR